MDIYKLKSFGLILIIYLLAMLPSFVLFGIKKNTTDIKKFIKVLCICTFIEIIFFSLIYTFPRKIVSVFPVTQNIKNYSIYALKILFIGSIFTPIHYTFPIYLFKQEKKKKAFILFSLKILYIPILIIINFVFSTKFALFAVPILDLIYTIFLLYNLFKYC